MVSELMERIALIALEKEVSDKVLECLKSNLKAGVAGGVDRQAELIDKKTYKHAKDT
tara:strand:- start:97538 stop:97708 length:171 start_codon:yes stop_codon:yes gene_type:complete